MKKISVLLTILVLCLSIIACGAEEEEVTDEDKILERIEDLQNAINSDNYTAFIDCMHSESELFDSYNETGLFDTQFDGEEYLFYDIEITVNGNLADVDCLADSLLATGTETYFEMRIEGDDWYVYIWNDDLGPIYYNYSSP